MAMKIKYALEYGHALALEREGKAVVVYMDESYVNMRHKRTNTWYNPNSAQSSDLNAGVGNGELFIMVHAITESGLFAAGDLSDGKEAEEDLDEEEEKEKVDMKDEGLPRVRPDYTKSGPQLSAEMIYRTKALPSDDYHKHFDSQMMEKWVTERLFPTFHAMYPDRQLILVLDNAKYHHARGEGWVSPNSMKKGTFCCAVLCYAVLCCAVLCCAVLCCVALCYALLCCAVLCCAMLCCAVLCCVVLCYAVLCCAVLCIY
jgi:hypothetical protein